LIFRRSIRDERAPPSGNLKEASSIGRIFGIDDRRS
jgi:hypothetical protein